MKKYSYNMSVKAFIYGVYPNNKTLLCWFFLVSEKLIFKSNNLLLAVSLISNLGPKAQCDAFRQGWKICIAMRCKTLSFNLILLWICCDWFWGRFIPSSVTLQTVHSEGWSLFANLKHFIYYNIIIDNYLYHKFTMSNLGKNFLIKTRQTKALFIFHSLSIEI